MTKTKRIQILCLLGAVTLLLSGCWTEAPVESANGLLGDQELWHSHGWGSSWRSRRKSPS